LQNFHPTYCEETIDNYELSRLFYNISHCSWSSLCLQVTAIATWQLYCPVDHGAGGQSQLHPYNR